MSDQPLREAVASLLNPTCLALRYAGRCTACESKADAVLGVVLERVTTTIEALPRYDATAAGPRRAAADADDRYVCVPLAELLAAVRRLGDTP
jgi:hypothetical protein